MDHSCEFTAGLTQSHGKLARIEAMRETVARRLMVEQNVSEINDNLQSQAKTQIEDRLTAILDAESSTDVCNDKTSCD